MGKDKLGKEGLRGERGQIVKVKKILRMSMEIDKEIKGNYRVRLRRSLVTYRDRS